MYWHVLVCSSVFSSFMHSLRSFWGLWGLGIVRIVRTEDCEDWGLWEQMLVTFATLSSDLRLHHQIRDFIIRFATLASDLRKNARHVCDFIIRFATLSSDLHGDLIRFARRLYHQLCDFIISCANFQWFQNDNMSHDISRYVQNKRPNQYVRASKPITISDDI